MTGLTERARRVRDDLPPHDLAAEQAVLGGCLLGGMHDARPVLRPEDFYRTAHSRIYAAMCRLDDDREPVDFLLLAGALQKAGHLAECGGEAYLTSLLTSTPTAAHTAHYAQLVADAARARRLIAAGVQVTGAAYDGWEAGDMDGAMDRAARLVMDADQRRRGAAARPVSDLLAHYYDRLDALSKGELPSGVSTGFTDLDKATGGWQPSDLIILAARPGMGKTSLLMAMAEHAASLGVGVLLFSLEMGAQALTHRLVSRRAQVDGHRLRLGLIRSEEWGAIHAALGDASELPLWVDDSAGLSVMEVRARARRLHQERPLGLIGVDYLQLMSGTGKEGNREQEIAGISRGLKALARELNVPVVVGAQLNRQAELRTGEKPLLSHLRESGQIEQDADVVLFLWRSDETPADLVDVSISKQRNGPLTDFRLTFQREHTAFRDHGWKHEGMTR